MLDKKIGYIEIATFGEHTGPEFVKAWNNLVASGAEGIVLDFRNN
jgi:C-terminal processing protease CtpA/Prc